MTAPDVYGPGGVPALRLWLREQWQPGRTFAVAAAAHGIRHGGDPNLYMQWERTHLQQATLWWVSADMVDLLMAAVPSVPDDVTVGQLVRPSPSGLVVFEKPISGIDAETGARTVQSDAIVWGGTALAPWTVQHPLDDADGGHRCLSVSSYRRLDFAMGMSASELELALATRAIEHGTEHYLGHTEQAAPRTHIAFDADGQAVEVTVGTEPGPKAKEGRAFSLTGTSWAPLGRSDWPLADAVGDWSFTPDERRFRDPNMTASAQEDRRLVAALWTLLGQEAIATTTTHVVPRAERRRSERAGVPPGRSDVQVVTLRRLHRTQPEGPPTDQPGGRYHVRWMVQGHWRNARVGPGRTMRRLTWVSPHLKGPDDAPLAAKTRVNAWVR